MTEQTDTTKTTATAKPDKVTICTYCGKHAVTTLTEEIGGHTTIEYHDCEQARQAAHDYFLATVNDPDTKTPKFLETKTA